MSTNELSPISGVLKGLRLMVKQFDTEIETLENAIRTRSVTSPSTIACAICGHS